jgi:hypothetical protein
MDIPWFLYRQEPATNLVSGGKLSNLFLRQSAPFRRGTPQVHWRRVRSFGCLRVDLTGFRKSAQSFQALAIVIKALGIVRPPLYISGQLLSRVPELPDGVVESAQFAKNLALVVFFVLIQHDLKLRERIFEPTLLASDASQLKMSIGL